MKEGRKGEGPREYEGKAKRELVRMTERQIYLQGKFDRPKLARSCGWESLSVRLTDCGEGGGGPQTCVG